MPRILVFKKEEERKRPISSKSQWMSVNCSSFWTKVAVGEVLSTLDQSFLDRPWLLCTLSSRKRAQSLPYFLFPIFSFRNLGWRNGSWGWLWRRLGKKEEPLSYGLFQFDSSTMWKMLREKALRTIKYWTANKNE